MPVSKCRFPLSSLGVLLMVWGGSALCQQAPVRVALDWRNVIGVSTANATIEVCLEPPLRRGYPLHDQLFADLHELGADYAHFQPWNVFPRLGIAELRPPADGKTYWDLSLLDQAAEDFMKATAGHPVIFNVGALPAWMFKTKRPVIAPEDPDAADWTYAEFNDRSLTKSTIRQAAAYQARLASWFVNGGFTDEYGKRHVSGHRFDIAYWEVLNEPDFEGNLTPTMYTQLYDAIVTAVRRVAPRMKFMGPAVGDATGRADYFAYFLDPRNHRAGTPIDMVSYHLFAIPDPDESINVQQYTFFRQADTFIATATYIDALRRRFVPTARTDADNIATMLPDPLAPTLAQPIPDDYWNLSGAVFAYLYGHLAVLGVDAVGASELIDFPGMAAASTLANWETGLPNARYWVLRLLRDNFGPGDQLIGAFPYTVLQPDPAPQLYSQGFIKPDGTRRVLLVNKRNAPMTVAIAEAGGGYEQTVDHSTAALPARRLLTRDSIVLPAFAVSVVTLPP